MSGQVVREAVDWESADVLMDFELPNPSLIVSGVLPYPMVVVVEPAPEIFAEPDYWPTFVVGYHGQIVLDIVKEYSVQVPLRELSIGKKGIELIGKTMTVNLDVPGASSLHA